MKFSVDDLKNIDIEKLNHFYLIYREKSILETSRKHDISLPILRHSLKTIELKLGIKLYYPSKRSFLPTEEAKDLFEFSEELINLLNKYKTTLPNNKVNKNEQRNLIIVTTTTIAHYYLPDYITIFLRDNPNVTVQIYSGPEYVNNRDFAFDILIGPDLNESNLIKKKFKRFVFKFYCSKGLKVKLSNISSPFDLKDQQLLLFAGTHYIDQKIIDNNEKLITSNSYPFLISMCSQGLGILSSLEIKNLVKFYKFLDIEVIFEDYDSEVEISYFYFSRLNKNVELINSFFNLINEY